ncbi:MAG: flagellar export protein FliJ [Lachnospiraceae bacterium]|nr:flagellar export protein FliJ [Lachnospiraceae bacterium]
MKKFVYKMQSVLSVKEKLEEQEKSRYAAAQAKLNEEEEKLAALKERRDACEERLRESVGAGLNIMTIRHNEDALETLKVFIKTQEFAVQKAEQNVEAAMYRLREAMAERKTQERLKEKAFEAYLVELGAEERKEVDELVSFRHGIRA